MDLFFTVRSWCPTQVYRAIAPPIRVSEDAELEQEIVRPREGYAW